MTVFKSKQLAINSDMKQLSFSNSIVDNNIHNGNLDGKTPLN